MSEVIIEIVKIDDWAALYIDGDKKLEGHSIRTDDLFEAMEESGLLENISFKTTWFDGTELETRMMENGEEFPQKRWHIKET